MEKIYDILVVGGGAAGISSAIYAKRANKNVAIIEKFAAGGQINMIGKIENYLGFASLEGSELAAQFAMHAKALNIPFMYEEVKEFDLTGKVKSVKTRKNVYQAKAVVLALGCHSRSLGIAGEEKFKGRGVSYCAVCDGNFFKDKVVAVVGSGDSAASDLEYLAGLCNKVYLISDKLNLISHSEQELIAYQNVEIVKTQPIEILGEGSVTGLKLSSGQILQVDAVFVAVGRKPDTDVLKGQVELDKQGFVITDEKMHTALDGVFAAGDVRANGMKQISTAVGDGAIAGTEAIKYVNLNKI